MNFKILSISLLTLSTLSCNIKTDGNFMNMVAKEGTGPIIDKTINMNFDEIKVSQSINATIIKSNKEKIVISAPNDVIDEILVENNGGKLYIHFKPNTQIRTHNIKATIYAKDFNRVEATSSAKIEIKDQFTQDKTDVKVSSSATINGFLEANTMSIEVSSSGDFEGRIWANDLTSEVSSSGDIKVKGKVKNATISASSSGDFTAPELIIENATLKASSSGSITTGVSHELRGAASSSGDINVSRKGSLNVVESKESSSGKVRVN